VVVRGRTQFVIPRTPVTRLIMATLDQDDVLIGETPAIRMVRDMVARLASKRIPVLVHGPTGAGKELVAHSLHLRSGRTGNYVPFNVCAIADTMFEDTLFGHTRGAFTGAVAESPGYMAEADGGTLFLDEIGGLGMAQQMKLLRALETGQFRPVGASRDRRSNFRLVSATNEDLPALVDEGRFRADLLHRLSGITLQVPPLRDRRDDIPLLVHHFLAAAFAGQPVRVSPGAMAALCDHDWPGNVRELRNALERISALVDFPEITATDVALALQPATLTSPQRSAARDDLLQALEACEWDPQRAARALQVHWTTVYRRMRRYGIVRPNGRGQYRGGSYGGGVVREEQVSGTSAN
jgi:DNA-binding NtrC family response regulator